MGGEKDSLRFYKNKMPFKAKQFNHIFDLDPYFKDLIGDKKEVWIADLGAGMFSTTGSVWHGVDVHLYPSDYLADEYGKLLDEANIVPVIPVEKQDMSNLTYESDFFDIVVCINALDHCENPFKALEEMYRVCKKGGWIYLRHQKNNGDFQNFKGMHHWNIDIDGDNLKIGNKEGSDTVYGFTSYIENIGGIDYIISKVKK